MQDGREGGIECDKVAVVSLGTVWLVGVKALHGYAQACGGRRSHREDQRGLLLEVLSKRIHNVRLERNLYRISQV